MPFTLSHVVVALPFRASRRLPLAGVAAGAVAPDLPLFAPIGVSYGVTHQVWAAPTVDVVLGLFLLVLWGVVLRPALLAVLPPAAGERMPEAWERPRVPRPAPALLAAIAFGALTHVVWDAFTHPGRWGTDLVPALGTQLAGLPVATWGQHASSLLGLLLLAWWGWRRLLREQRRPRPAVLAPAVRRTSAGVAAAALVTGAAGAGLAHRGSGPASVAFAAATGGMDAAGAVLILLGVVLGYRSTTR